MENFDEGEEYTNLLGIKRGFYYMLVIFCILIIGNFFTKYFYGKSLDFNYGLSSMYFCFLSSNSYMKFKFTNETKYKMICIVVSLAMFLLFIASFKTIL
jgi:uncharacterized membrane protein YoaT (DUF817 family)